ncbi:MAG TPA: ABC transporter ATP-binding protein [Candidatus Dormibacteraeota bacterium]|nr:ABC transporter ATP-binding protein [Candidatus Dormibacteraeota bacterium]
MGGDVRLVNLTKRFGTFTAVDGINLEIPAGMFFSLLGPSGCGKTTTLRMIGGFEQPTSGQVVLDGVDIANTPPNRRHVNTVFQSYALFPHMTVFDNVAFGLRRGHVSGAEVKRRVGEVLSQVEMSRFAARKPAQLSGGQQQRVALARALVLKPAVLLLDEPLGALDAKLRRQLQLEIKALQEQVGITFIYVTHDQEEAITMSDRIAVMNSGHVEQEASPRVMYEEPATAFVANFLGVSNLFEVEATGAAGDGVALRLGAGVTVEATQGDVARRGPVQVVIRPERVRVEAAGGTGANRVPATVSRTVYIGNGVRVFLELASGQDIVALAQNLDDDGAAQAWKAGDRVTCVLPPNALRVLPGAARPAATSVAPAVAVAP